MFRLVLPAALVLVVIYTTAGAWRLWAQRHGTRRRTWALFAGPGPSGRLLRRRVERADPAGIVAIYRVRRDAALAERLGVTDEPTLVLGDGNGGVKARLVGRRAIIAFLDRRAY